MQLNEHFDMALHKDDHWMDQIILRGPYRNSPMHELLRLTTRYRYKTSGLSGDEWRTSTEWQICSALQPEVQGDTEPREQGWSAFDGPYWGKLDAGGAALFPGLFSSQHPLHDREIACIDFVRKDRLLYRSTYDGQSQPLIIVAGCLPWALMKAQDEPLKTDEAWEDMRAKCFQPGCSNIASSTYALKYRYDNDGSKSEAVATRFLTQWESRGIERGYGPRLRECTVRLARRFCRLHLRRGDCGLDDADSNYDVIDGPGPEHAHGWETYESKSRRIQL